MIWGPTSFCVFIVIFFTVIAFHTYQRVYGKALKILVSNCTIMQYSLYNHNDKLRSSILEAPCSYITMQCTFIFQLKQTNQIFALKRNILPLRMQIILLCQSKSKCMKVYRMISVSKCEAPYKEIQTGSTKKCLFISSVKGNWTSAKQACENEGAHLLTFASKAESVVLLKYLHGRGE